MITRYTRTELMEKIDQMLADSDDRVVAEVASMLSEMSVSVVDDEQGKIFEVAE